MVLTFKTKPKKIKRTEGEERRNNETTKVGSEVQIHETKTKSDNCQNDDIVIQIGKYYQFVEKFFYA